MDEGETVLSGGGGAWEGSGWVGRGVRGMEGSGWVGGKGGRVGWMDEWVDGRVCGVGEWDG